jgi:hypothetical protein
VYFLPYLKYKITTVKRTKEAINDKNKIAAVTDILALATSLR